MVGAGRRRGVGHSTLQSKAQINAGRAQLRQERDAINASTPLPGGTTVAQAKAQKQQLINDAGAHIRAVQQTLIDRRTDDSSKAMGLLQHAGFNDALHMHTEQAFEQILTASPQLYLQLLVGNGVRPGTTIIGIVNDLHSTNAVCGICGDAMTKMASGGNHRSKTAVQATLQGAGYLIAPGGLQVQQTASFTRAYQAIPPTPAERAAAGQNNANMNMPVAQSETPKSSPAPPGGIIPRSAMTDGEYADWLQRALALEGREGAGAMLSLVREARRDDADPRLRLREGITLAKLEQWRAAIDVLEGVPPGTPFAHLGLSWRARALLALGQLSDALESAERAALAVPALFGAKTLYGELLFRVGRHDDAIRVLRETVAAFPKEAEPKEILSLHLRWIGQLAEAEALARSVTVEHPDRDIGYGRFGEALIDQGKFDEALTALALAQERAPAHAEWSRLAAHCLVQLGRSEQALKLVNDAALAQPGSLDFSLNVARLHSTQADPPVAEAVITRVVKQYPRVAELYALLATAKARSGDLDAADRTLKEGLSYPPVPPWMENLARERGLLT